MAHTATRHYRARGAGTIQRSRKGRPGWEAYGPKPRGEVAKWLGHFDTYKQAETALDRFIRDEPVRKAG